MYTVLIADDEEWIRKAIVKRVLSCGLTLEIAAEAGDGKEAYELAVATRPDIIITDIKMPYMNGLKLIEELKSLLPRTKFIVISGYADFEFARSALQLKVCQYILKTVDDHILKEALIDAIQQIKNEDASVGQLNYLEAKLAERTHVMQKHFIQELVSSNSLTEEYIRRMIRNLDLPFEIQYYFCMLVLELDISVLEGKNINELTNRIYSFLANNNYTGFVFGNSQGYNELNVLLYSSADNQFNKLHLFDLTKRMKESFNNAFSLVGISNTYKSCLELNKAYVEAMDALKNKKMLKNKESHCIYFQDICANESFTTYFTSADERNLAYYIETGNTTDAISCITAIFEKIKETGQISTKMLTKLYYEIILLLENILDKHQISVEQVLEVDFLSLINAPKISSLESLEELIKSFSTRVAEYLAIQNNDDPKLLLDNIKNYIENNYFEPITLDTIAQKFFISKAYFSQLFKKETDMTFISYLTSIRMNHAIELLKNNNFKVHEVAKMVGYSDPLYFGQVFKKHFGVLPSEY